MKIRVQWVLLFLLLPVLTFSLGSDCNQGDPLQQARKLLYVLDNANKAVYILENVDTIDGTVSPVQTLEGDKTLLTDPRSVAVDQLRDILYVSDASQGLILVFAPASTLDGDVEPRRTLPGLGNVQEIFLDVTNNRLYVFNATDFTIMVWDNVSTRNNDGPDRIFGLGFLASAIFVDTQRDFLYAGDFIARTIVVYNQASTLIGDPQPTRLIFDSIAPFDRIDSITMNVPNDLLFFANGLTPAIPSFDRASTVEGDVEPDKNLEGDMTQLSFELGLIRFLEDSLYAKITTTQIAVYDSANNLDGNLAPNRVINPEGTQRIISFDIDLLH